MELHEEPGASMHPERPDRVRAVMARLQVRRVLQPAPADAPQRLRH